MKALVVLFCVLGVSVAQMVTIDPVGAVTVVEGNNLTINCTDTVIPGNDFSLLENNNRLAADDIPSERSGTSRIFQLSVDRTKNGNTYKCEGVIARMMSENITLTVTWPPTLSLASKDITLTIEDSNTFSFTVTDGNPRSNMTITGPSQPNNSRVSISSDGVVAINMVLFSDAGTHVATWNNGVEEAATFTLDLTVNPVCYIACIIGIVVGVIGFIALVIVAAVTVLLVMKFHKRRQKTGEDNMEDKAVSLT